MIKYSLKVLKSHLVKAYPGKDFCWIIKYCVCFKTEQLLYGVLQLIPKVISTFYPSCDINLSISV